jgi:hypothetical protein
MQRKDGESEERADLHDKGNDQDAVDCQFERPGDQEPNLGDATSSLLASDKPGDLGKTRLLRYIMGIP